MASHTSSATPPSRPASAAPTAGAATHGQQHQQQRAKPGARPPLRSTFDLEPNPFEQSFSTGPGADSADAVPTLARTHPHPRRSPPRPSASPDNASSTSGRASSAHAAPGGARPGGAPDGKPVLPSVAALTSPADPSAAWGITHAHSLNSLRSGPLSPAMLAGPAAPPAAAPATAYHGSPGLFDSAFRTGLTPSTGLTPAGVLGGPVSFPPPSPNTAAFLAMVHGAAPPGPAITPNTLTAITNQFLNASAAASTANGPPTAGINPAATTSQHPHPLSHSHVPHYDDPAPASTTTSRDSRRYDDAQQSAANTAANGLFLLSQAHQELTKREKEAHSYSASLNPDANGNAGAAGRKKRKAAGPPPNPHAQETKPAPHKRTKNARGASARTVKSIGSDDDMDDIDMDDIDMDEFDAQQQGGKNAGGGQQTKKFETEEEKRRNFLERNRQAALKCRQRKKAWLAQLQAKVEFLGTENERLTQALVSARQEISRLSALVPPSAVADAAAAHNGHNGHGAPGQAGHPGSGVVAAGQVGQGQGGQPGAQGGPGGPPVSVSMNLPHTSAVKAGAINGARGYGY